MRTPFNNFTGYNRQGNMYIAIEGNIGSGKSTLAGLLAQHYNAPLVLEEFADNNFLPKFYEEPERYAFPLEVSFLADRYKQLTAIGDNTPAGQTIISDYTFAKSSLFAGINLEAHEYELFSKLYNIMKKDIKEPDLLIYLSAPVDKLLANIKKRGRPYEQNIQPAYLEKIESIYLQYLETVKHQVMVVNMEPVDFTTNDEDFKYLVNRLDAYRQAWLFF